MISPHLTPQSKVQTQPNPTHTQFFLFLFLQLQYLYKYISRRRRRSLCIEIYKNINIEMAAAPKSMHRSSSRPQLDVSGAAIQGNFEERDPTILLPNQSDDISHLALDIGGQLFFLSIWFFLEWCWILNCIVEMMIFLRWIFC